MRKPPVPADEKTRLAKLSELGIIYSPAEERFDRITILARKIFDVPIALVSLVSEKCQWFKSAQGLGAAETPREISFCGHAILHDDVLIIPDTTRDPDFADNPLVTGAPFIRFYAGQPLKYQGSNLGTLCIIDRVPRQMSPSDIDTLRSLAGWAENEIRVSALSQTQKRLLTERDEARREALIDPLTKVWNRNGMDELMDREIADAVREHQRISLMVLDVDHYKAINDRHGHVAGDVALAEIAQRIRLCVRPHDVVARFGGDEFVVMAVGGSDADAWHLAERILARTRNEPIDTGEAVFPVSLTIGMTSTAATKELQLSELIEQADNALLEAKKAGRNRIIHKTA